MLAEKTSLSVAAVREYEKEGLIIAHRAASGRRLFSQEDISRVRNIHHMIQDLGFNREGIRRAVRRPVHRFGSLCAEDVKTLLHEQDDPRNADPAI